MGRLDDLDLSLKLSREEEAERLEAAQTAAAGAAPAVRRPARPRLARRPPARPAACWRCSRAGTRPARAARSSGSSPRSTRATCAWPQFAAPTYDEKRHHFLWRFWPALPGWGGMAVLDRSWYGRVLVERVEGFADQGRSGSAPTRRSASFERSLAAEGMMLLKFWLHISDEEQLKRFEARARRTRSSAGSSPTRTGATARSAAPTRARSRTCSSARTATTRRGTSSRPTPSATRA